MLFEHPLSCQKQICLILSDTYRIAKFPKPILIKGLQKFRIVLIEKCM